MGKIDYIDAYFRKWVDDIERAGRLLENDEYALEGYLVLVCYLGALAELRFPDMNDNEKYRRFTLEYSGNRAFFEQIDLLFLYQWPRSKLRDHGLYKAFEEHSDVVSALTPKFGSESDLSVSNRNVSMDAILAELKTKIQINDEAKVRENLELFSLVQLLYRYGRCDAVHNADYPLINEGRNADGRVLHDNSALTRKVIFSTVQSSNKNLWEECTKLMKWPYEISNAG